MLDALRQSTHRNIGYTSHCHTLSERMFGLNAHKIEREIERNGRILNIVIEMVFSALTKIVKTISN